MESHPRPILTSSPHHQTYPSAALDTPHHKSFRLLRNPPHVIIQKRMRLCTELLAKWAISQKNKDFHRKLDYLTNSLALVNGLNVSPNAIIECFKKPRVFNL
jgi:hypothetical protein